MEPIRRRNAGKLAERAELPTVGTRTDAQQRCSAPRSLSALPDPEATGTRGKTASAVTALQFAPAQVLQQHRCLEERQ